MEHDRLFKERLRTFFTEFISAFVPNVEEFLDLSSIEFLDKEVFTDLTAGQRHEVDLLVKARFKGKDTFFLVHVENQASAQEDFAGRMFRYFARLHEKFSLPVYPIALLSYENPRCAEPSRYEINFPGLKVLSFEFQAIQLNQLNWRDYLRSANPVAAALYDKDENRAQGPAAGGVGVPANDRHPQARSGSTVVHIFVHVRVSSIERRRIGGI